MLEVMICIFRSPPCDREVQRKRGRWEPLLLFFFLKENLEIVAPGGIKGMEMKSCIDSQQLKNSVWDSILLTFTIRYKKFKLLGLLQLCSNPCPLGFSPNCIFFLRFSQLFALECIDFPENFYTT